MSRIDQALRRALEQDTNATTASDEAKPELVSGPEATAFAKEPFPVELAEQRRLRRPAIAATAKTAEFVSSNATSGAAADQTEQLFGRLDPNLAEKIVADSNISPVSREQYRRIAAVLHDAQGTSGLRVVMIASAVPGEGKTLTAANVALTFSESYHKRVLLIDADLRRPALHQLFQLEAATGLIDTLQAKTDVPLLLRQVTPRLSVLPAGRPTSDPMAGLTSTRMARLIEEARESFDWVIIDTPPLMLLPDGHLLSLMVDKTVLVIRANSTSHDLVKRAADIIGKDRIAGVVLNQAADNGSHSYGGNYYHGYYLSSAAKER